MDKKISIKDIAEMAGVSVATVSRVINQNGRFSKDTEDRVLGLIHQYGYRPNELARGLRVNHAQVVGVLVPDIMNEFFSGIAAVVESNLLQQGYMAIICDTKEDLYLERQYIDMLLSLQVGGIIYVCGSQKIAPIEKIPAVYIDRQPTFTGTQENVAFIGSDNYRGGYLAGKRLLDAGCKKPVIVLHNKTIATQRKRLSGYKKALRDGGMDFEKQMAIKVDVVDLQHGYQVTKELWESESGIDGIFYASDLLAIGGLQYFNEQQIKIPEQVSVIGFDGIPLGGVVSPALTTIRQSYQQFGSLAAEVVVRMMKEKTPYQEFILPVELLERNSVWPGKDGMENA